ncbi:MULTISPECIES: hypothetical protein [Sorangium]|uniref:Cytochrome c domain-containing protein n=1 Tax=Sorangium cellulosum TaxID=56 RepID=A0A4P2R743_SORCE|nr:MULTISPECIES: hypothetical protein [Sorangium]AUX37873.1 hypothetical protein SOCE836_101090 [Sorangium cellulosum]WCQ97161.1 hypothetical protein NQZ70_09952 [Sorangium sp. Soce836]
MMTHLTTVFALVGAAIPLGVAALSCSSAGRSEGTEHIASAEDDLPRRARFSDFDALTERNTDQLLRRGREIFRFDTFGDEQFWGGKLRLHESIANVTPAQALALGLKVDVDALPPRLRGQIERGQVDLDDPAVTLRLLRLDAILGVTGFFDGRGELTSIGLQCAFCHSTVNDSVAPGIGKRLDGWANRDLNVGAIVASAPTLQPLVDLLPRVPAGVTEEGVRNVLLSWGPGKYDAELILDGKAFRPDGKSAATLLPNAFDMGGINEHTWTGNWGSVPYWNAYVAVTQMHGKGNFFDPRLDDPEKYPNAAATGIWNVIVEPEDDLVTSKLPALHFYQLALPAPRPVPGVDFDEAAAEHGKRLFVGKAKCTDCHNKPLWTDAGWNLHTPEEMRIDDFQANRAPGDSYKTMNLAALFVRERGLFMKPENKGRFYHDGRFATLLDVVRSYDERFALGLDPDEERDLVEYLKSL